MQIIDKQYYAKKSRLLYENTKVLYFFDFPTFLRKDFFACYYVFFLSAMMDFFVHLQF